MQSEPDSIPPGLLKQSWAAFQANLIPGVILWCVGCGIVVSYYFVPAVTEVLDRIASVKESFGLIYSIPSMMIFAAIIPFFMQRLMRGGARKTTAGYLVFLLAYWGYKGAEIDLLYRFQAWMFGDDASASTVIFKTLFDQFIYVPLWAVPTMAIPFAWANADFRGSVVREKLRGPWIRELVLPVLIPNWLVWIPTVVLIYLLPTPLQFPIQNLICCLWVLMLIFLTMDEAGQE